MRVFFTLLDKLERNVIIYFRVTVVSTWTLLGSNSLPVLIKIIKDCFHLSYNCKCFALIHINNAFLNLNFFAEGQCRENICSQKKQGYIFQNLIVTWTQTCFSIHWCQQIFLKQMFWQLRKGLVEFAMQLFRKKQVKLLTCNYWLVQLTPNSFMTETVII